MGKVKTMMIMDEYDVGTTKEYDHAFPMMQATLFAEPVNTGLQNTTFPPWKHLKLDGNGQTAGNNFFSPSMTEVTSSAASKPETLILNAQAKPSITTKEKKAKAGQFTNTQDTTVQEKLKKALAEIELFYATATPVPF